MTCQSFDPNDKPYWCEQGRFAEREFLLFVAPAHGLKARMNIHKLVDFWAPDIRVDGALADLKAQRTPFFTAGRYHLDPQFTVILNRNDLERYGELGENVVIYFWVRWDSLSGHYGGHTHQIRPMEGLWRIAVSEIQHQIEDDGIVPLHRYQTRLNDTSGNARDSYLLDLGRMEHVPLATKEAS